MIYDEKPDNFNYNAEVVSCSILYGDEILLLLRLDNKIHGNKWGTPGGKIEKDDKDRISALVREIKEETGIIIKMEDLIFHKTFFVSHSDSNFLYHYFQIKLKEKPNVVINKDEHKDFVWVTPEKALKMFLVLDEDHCIKHLYKI